jgi:hypothetical protein
MQACSLHNRHLLRWLHLQRRLLQLLGKPILLLWPQLWRGLLWIQHLLLLQWRSLLPARLLVWSLHRATLLRQPALQRGLLHLLHRGLPACLQALAEPSCLTWLHDGSIRQHAK